MIESQPIVLSLTDAAAVKLQELTKDEASPEIGLRVYVYSGGCSGACDNVLQSARHPVRGLQRHARAVQFRQCLGRFLEWRQR